MKTSTRRTFLSDVGYGMLAAGVGASLASDLGCSTSFAAQGSDAIPLGEHAALVELMRSTPAEKLQPLLAAKVLRGETSMEKLTAAGGLANAGTFGGCE
jgi:hypothetical protein